MLRSIVTGQPLPDNHISYLWVAIRENNICKVRDWIRLNSANVNLADTLNTFDPWSACTPLGFAAKKGYEAVVEALVAAGADVNQAKNHTQLHETPLFNAAYMGHESIVVALIAAGADVNQAVLSGWNNDSCTPLYVAACKGYKYIAVALIAAGADVNQASERKGETPLYIAVKEGHEAIVMALIAAGADVNQFEFRGTTPLFIAARQGHDAVAAALIAAGADVNVNTNNGTTPLYIASAFGHKTTAAALIAAGADVNVNTNNGTTPLYIAAEFCRETIVEAMYNNVAGAPLLLTRFTSAPAAIKAATMASCQNSAALLATGSDMNQATTNKTRICGTTPLYIAAQKGHEAIAMALVAAGANVNQVRTHDGTTPLHMAAQNGHEAIAKALVAAGANVRCIAANGKTAHALARMRGHQSLFKMLLSQVSRSRWRWAISQVRAVVTFIAAGRSYFRNNVDAMFSAGYGAAKVPSEFMCPITMAIFKDPVVAADGFTYERCALEKHLQMHREPRSPQTNLTLPCTTVFANTNMRIMVDDIIGRGRPVFARKQAEDKMVNFRQSMLTELPLKKQKL